MIPRRARWLCVMGLGLLSACATQEQQSRQQTASIAAPVSPAWSFETEWARAAAESAPGSAVHAWERAVNPTVEQAYGAVLDDCESLRNPDDPGFHSAQRVILVIARSGSVRVVWSETDSPLLTCARASLNRAQFTPPPVDGYRLGLQLHLGEPGLPSDFERLPRPPPGPVSSDEAIRLAVTDMASEEGQAYVQRFSSAFTEYVGLTLQRCMTIPLLDSERLLRGYGLIIEIGLDGVAQRSLVRPDPEVSASEEFWSPRAMCLLDGMLDAPLAVPPWDGFWMFVGLANPPPAMPTE